MECGDGGGALVCADGGESLRSPGPGAEAQYRTPAIAGILLRSKGETGWGAEGVGRRELFCAVVGMGVELVGRDAACLSGGCDHARATVCGASGECRLSGLCDSGGVDGVTGDGEVCVARRMAADVASGT